MTNADGFHITAVTGTSFEIDGTNSDMIAVNCIGH